ncbi:MAG: DNA polymerase III subunit delta [Coriobacteriales bacterium]|jgi:DNA polymerase-3 subunit delta|nr:DNA polymerase III subunit delta [Coriobacteriales bacterium]
MAEKPLLRLYLFNGEDVLKQETLLERLRQRLAAQGDLLMNSQVFSAKEIPSADVLLNALNTIPFGAPVRLVVIKDTDTLSSALQNSLITYIQNPSPTTVLVLVAKKLSVSGRLYKAILAHDRNSVVDCGSKKRSELPLLIRNMARSRGIDITTEAANLLVDLVGASTVSLDTEVAKLVAIAKAAGSGRIEDEDVAHNVARLVEPKPWDLTNALALRDTALCLQLVDRMRGYTAVGLFTQCVTKLREILTAATLKKRGLPVAATMGKRDWQLREVMQGTERYRQDELESLLKRAPEIEMRMKTGADADQLLRLWVIDACARKNSVTV